MDTPINDRQVIRLASNTAIHAVSCLMASMSTTSIGSKRSSDSVDDNVWLSWRDVLELAGITTSVEKLSKLDSHLPLRAFCLMSEKFKGLTIPLLFSELGIVVDVQAIMDACNRIGDDPASLKRRHVERNVTTPSDIAKIEGYTAFMRRVPHLVCNHRPGHGFPVTLQVRAFGEFVDVLKVKADVDYRKMALQLMLSMSRVYSNEAKRQEALQDIFQQNNFSFTKVANTGYKCDLSIKNSDNDKVIANFELKAELGYDGKNPNWQNVAYFVHITKDQRQGDSLPRNPMLLVSLCGCDYLQVFGASWHGGCVCVDPLSGPLSLLHVPDNIESIEALARVLSALRATLDKLNSYNDDDTSHPYFIDDSKLTYVSQVKDTYLFRAKYNTDSGVDVDVMVKFVKRYGVEVHAYLADLNLAPKLHKVEELPGGWMAVIMDEVDGCKLVDVTREELAEADYAGFRTTLIQKLQEKDFVHGDLRCQNILFSDTKEFLVVDLDWAGKKGHVKYPLTINMSSSCGWASGVAPDGLIDSSHDQHQLDTIY